MRITSFLARRPQPQPTTPAPDVTAVAAGLRAFADDLDAGDAWALECLGETGELPHDAREWAEYPHDLVRRIRIAYLGRPGPGEVPDAPTSTGSPTT
ncbi:hypothetical protein [Streptomyces sp. NPDC090994]|uniref:hypothetical protein n=1 Tax=Streptomyces sp. NPDC090994 TaxID=3365969 RepID=UPI003819DF08